MIIDLSKTNFLESIRFDSLVLFEHPLQADIRYYSQFETIQCTYIYMGRH